MEQYKIGPVLGEGCYGTVRVAEDMNGNRVAIKSVVKKTASGSAIARLQSEAEIMRNFNHRHVMKLVESHEDYNAIHIVMQLAERGELLHYVTNKGKLCERQCRRLFRQLVSGVHYMHSKGYVHRDLKLENILLTANKEVKIIDFGFATKWSRDRQINEPVGSLFFCAPDILQRRPYYGPEVDCWALGIVLAAISCGRLPFVGDCNDTVAHRICLEEPELDPSLSLECISLIRGLLCKEAEWRFTTGDVLAHPFLKPRRIPRSMPTPTPELPSNPPDLLPPPVPHSECIQDPSPRLAILS